METIDVAAMGVAKEGLVLDLGAGGGRHALRAAELGYKAFALDLSPDGLLEMKSWIESVSQGSLMVSSIVADGTSLPFKDETFDAVICSEVLEHLENPKDVLAEVARVVKPGGKVGLSVPRTYPEAICWLISKEYHSAKGGHIRIFTRSALHRLTKESGLKLQGTSYTHALHSLYWWLKCLVGVDERDLWVVRAYERMLLRQMSNRSGILNQIDKKAGVLFGKSVVIYARR